MPAPLPPRACRTLIPQTTARKQTFPCDGVSLRKEQVYSQRLLCGKVSHLICIVFVCHPERSRGFAKRSSDRVEGPLHPMIVRDVARSSSHAPASHRRSYSHEALMTV